MIRTMMPSEIHRATVTQADQHHVGSATVGQDLLDAADLLPGELVHLVDGSNRIVQIGTDAAEVPAGSGLRSAV